VNSCLFATIWVHSCPLSDYLFKSIVAYCRIIGIYSFYCRLLLDYLFKINIHFYHLGLPHLFGRSPWDTAKPVYNYVYPCFNGQKFEGSASNALNMIQFSERF
jgi:hypothetical protein